MFSESLPEFIPEPKGLWVQFSKWGGGGAVEPLSLVSFTQLWPGIPKSNQFPNNIQEYYLIFAGRLKNAVIEGFPV